MPHLLKLSTAPRNVIGGQQPLGGLEIPPANTTSGSAVPRKARTLIGRSGWHGISSSRSKALGVAAAKMSAALHARKWDIPPPIENPVVYTRLASMHPRFSTSETMARAKPRSSTSRERVQQGPMFHALSMPLGQAMTNPF